MRKILLTDEYVKSPMARSIPGAFWDTETKHWCMDFEQTPPRAAIVALKLFPQLSTEYPELTELRDKGVQDVRPFDNATPFDQTIKAHLVKHELEESGLNFYQFQRLDLGYVVEILKQHGGAYIGWERGLGKTLGACSIMDALEVERILVVAPNTAKSTVWLPEIRRWLPQHTVKVLPNQKDKREAFLRRLKDDEFDSPLIVIVHYEALDLIAKKRKDGRGWDRYGEWDLVIADEAHRIKNPTAKMSRALKKVPTKYKLALSGSIIQNHAEELFSPLQWLFPERYKSKWRDWNDRYLDYVDGGYSKICVGVKLDRLNDLRDELGVFMVYRRKSDELDLPPRTDQTMYVELSNSQRKAYDELAAQCLTELEDGTRVKAVDGLVLLGKLRQIASGLDLISEEVTDSTKLDLAMELINDTPDEATVVFGWYKASIYALQARLEAAGVDTFVVTGDVRQEKRGELIERFQNGEGRVFLGTLATLGESVNLQRASQAIFLDRHWNPALNVQAEDRIHRMGQTKPVTITHIIAKDTVDEHRVLPTITNKEALRQLILGG